MRSGLPGEPRARRRPGRRAYLQATHADPRSDAELRDRVQEALDRLVSHPRALHVSVDNGVVRLSGRVLAQERDGLLAQVQRMAGVQKLVNAMTAHGDPQELTSRAAPVPLAAASR